MVFPQQRTGHMDLEISGDLRIHGLSHQNMCVCTRTCTCTLMYTCMHAHSHRHTYTKQQQQKPQCQFYGTKSFLLKLARISYILFLTILRLQVLVIPVLVKYIYTSPKNNITNLHITCMLIIYNNIPSVLKCFNNIQGCAVKFRGLENISCLQFTVLFR